MQNIVFLLLFVGIMANDNKTLGNRILGNNKANPASSCDEIYQRNPTSRGTIGQYWIATGKGIFKVTCNMKLKCGGVEGGWMQVVDVDMSRDVHCPGTWQQGSDSGISLCYGYAAGCSSAYFYAKGYRYENICGQAKAYQKGSPDAFGSRLLSLDSAYVDGISITIGSPRRHVWTYAAGLSDNETSYSCCNCPCAAHPGPPPPSFVRNDYYCESGNVGLFDFNTLYLHDSLWDGSNCTTHNGCCDQIGLPWFHRRLLMHVTEDFEVRICKSHDYNEEDIAIEKLDIFVL